ncbi:hypothetical protein ANCDUO_00207 [Ancylostoma duodenale]|uniref:IQ calmodulin-binding motif protein n=1 Tax=Ancylostoma duodenale TaxID=51022 RepID=A0A0C2HIM5_9BILA|nr:hypothetical protein ANCDUO_00207 [Ancylostoma duodenale]
MSTVCGRTQLSDWRGISSASRVYVANGYEISDDLQRRRVEVLEKRYGGRACAHRAAIVIQRAYRDYRLNRRWREMTSPSQRFSNSPGVDEQLTIPAKASSKLSKNTTSNRRTCYHCYDIEMLGKTDQILAVSMLGGLIDLALEIPSLGWISATMQIRSTVAAFIESQRTDSSLSAIYPADHLHKHQPFDTSSRCTSQHIMLSWSLCSHQRCQASSAKLLSHFN